MDAAMLDAVLGESARCVRIEHLETCGSTNTVLLQRASQGAAKGLAIVADRQTAGRGRRGRAWVSEPGFSLTFSLLWQFPAQTPTAGLSLAVGVAIAQALEDLGFEGLGLKWPNDIWLFGRKLGGVLIELVFAPQSYQAVIGIGLNLRQHPAWQSHIDQEFTALADAAVPPPREILLGSLLRRLVATLQIFEQQGFAAFCADWNRRNALRGLPVRVSSENEAHRGVCGSVADSGALELQLADGGLLQISGGDVSLCPDTPFFA